MPRQERDTVAKSLADEHIGLEETHGGIWSLYFNTACQ